MCHKIDKIITKKLHIKTRHKEIKKKAIKNKENQIFYAMFYLRSLIIKWATI